MNTLHTLNASIYENSDVLARLLRCATTGDSVLLLENGVYNLRSSDAIQTITDAGLLIYCLQADCIARGIASDPARTVNDNGFVDLTCTHRKVVSWFV